MKGHGVLLEAWRSVVRRRPDARLLIVGTGVLESALRRQVEMASMSTSVHFAGFVPDLQDWFAAMDVLVLASVRDEGCNNTLLETMARGRPAVVTRCGGLPEQVESGQSGWIVQPDDPAALAEALTESLTNPDERARRGARALELARERYAPERVLASWESLFEELLAPGAGLSR
jgi:glycosyltransferase involved in cell wall biosynthesis